MNTIIGTDIAYAASLLANDEVVAMPTETVYGLAGNGFSETAVRKIYAVKNRPLYNPLILHVPSTDSIPQLVKHIPETAHALLKKFAPGPLTFLLPKKEIVPDLITAGSHKVAIRIPQHPMALQLLENCSFPVAAPSANPFGYISPTKPEHVFNQLKNTIPYILDGGNCDAGVESTVVGFNENDIPVIYRLGVITQEQIKAEVEDCLMHESNADKHLQSPGMLKYHYSPKTKLIISNQLSADVLNYNADEIAVITFQNQLPQNQVKHQIQLSTNGSLTEAAHNLYAALHSADALNVKLIIAEEHPNTGIGKTINERLWKAAAK